MTTGAAARASQVQEVRAFRENVEAKRRSAQAAMADEPTMESADRRRLTDESRERLREVVIDLFAEGLFHEVGMREIAKRAGVGLATIYKYFGAKEDMVVACLEPDMERLLQALALASRCEVGTRRRARAYMIAFVRFHLENPHIADIVHVNTPARLWVETDGGWRTDQLAVYAEILRHGARDGSVRSDVDTDDLVRLTAGAMKEFVLSLLGKGVEDRDPDAEGEHLFTAVWPMVCA
ncbi:MAG: TetR/AcrR family transcriptional regulator [Pseudomonadota bacterium]